MVSAAVPETKKNTLAVSMSICASNATVGSGNGGKSHFGVCTDQNAALCQAG